MHAAGIAGARVVKVPLTSNYSHDVRAMLAQAPDAGLFYICTPNNPTGTLTSHSDIEYLVEHKPQGSVVMVDEAYIHFADGTTSAIDLVKAGKDVIVLRTFSKIYGMAGLRCGFSIARPDLQKKIGQLSRLQSHADYGGGRRQCQSEGREPGAGAQAHQHGHPRAGIRLAAHQRLLVHSLAVELLHARHPARWPARDRGHAPAERLHRAHLAGDADLRARDRRHAGRDGPVPDGVQRAS